MPVALKSAKEKVVEEKPITVIGVCTVGEPEKLKVNLPSPAEFVPLVKIPETVSMSEVAPRSKSKIPVLFHVVVPVVRVPAAVVPSPGAKFPLRATVPPTVPAPPRVAPFATENAETVVVPLTRSLPAETVVAPL